MAVPQQIREGVIVTKRGRRAARTGGRARRYYLICGLAIAAALTGCAESFAGIPSNSKFSDPQLQMLAERARAGDGQAQFELGVRYEEGRGIARNYERARQLYLASIRGSGRVQVSYVPVGGSVSPEISAIGKEPFWPNKISDLLNYPSIRVDAVLRYCGLQESKSRDGNADCASDKVNILRDLRNLEVNFRRCRVAANFGMAGENPWSFGFESGDNERGLAVRDCLFANDVPGTLSSDTARLVWVVWAALHQVDGCDPKRKCRAAAGLREQFENLQLNGREDSLLAFALQTYLADHWLNNNQVGRNWWKSTCPRFPRLRPRPAEQAICNLITLSYSN